MFTGLVQEVGIVQEVDLKEGVLSLVIGTSSLSSRVKVGDSVAVDGCCLTAVSVEGPLLSFQAVPETLKRTNLGRLQKGMGVNLETSLTLQEPLGGHFVQGHVDGLAELLWLKPEGDGSRMRVRFPERLTAYIVEKGSIALNGISLTVAHSIGNELEVALIPHTMKNTDLGERKKGDQLNVEVDLLAKYVERQMEPFRERYA